MKVLSLSASVGSAKFDFASRITKGAFKISKTRKVKMTTTAAAVKRVTSSFEFVCGRT